jgi:hypothetical protein
VTTSGGHGPSDMVELAVKGTRRTYFLDNLRIALPILVTAVSVPLAFLLSDWLRRSAIVRRIL